MKFNIPYVVKNQMAHFQALMNEGRYQSGGSYDKRIKALLASDFAIENAYLVNSCTTALELTAMVLEIGQGDEIIMPSFTYVSTANAFVRQGGKPVFVETDGQFNMSVAAVKAAISRKTKAVVVVHYGGHCGDLLALKDLCMTHGLQLIEDAAQCIDSFSNGQHLGTIGDFGCISFHETKNIHCGEGGLLVINNKDYFKKIALIVEKGTDRQDFAKGLVAKYTWQSWGTSCLLSEIQCAFLYGQLMDHEKITKTRQKLWQTYGKNLVSLTEIGISLPPMDAMANGHCFYLLTRNSVERDQLINFLGEKNIQSVSHFELLHRSDFAKDKYVFFGDEDLELAKCKSMVRLPMHMDLSLEDVVYVCEQVKEFYHG